MSSQGPVGKQTTIQGDSSNWTQLLKRQKTYRGLVGITWRGLSGNNTGVRSDLLQSNQLQTDYRLGAAGCGVGAPYPQLATGQGC
jgi:hypothetical protein